MKFNPPAAIHIYRELEQEEKLSEVEDIAIHWIRVRVRASSAKGVLCSVLGFGPVRPSLDNLDLICLMSTHRAMRRVAALELNRLKNDVVET